MISLTKSANGRFVIPVAIRTVLALKARTPLYAEIRDGGLLRITSSQRNVQCKAYFEQMLTAPKTRVASQELIAERRAEA